MTIQKKIRQSLAACGGLLALPALGFGMVGVLGVTDAGAMPVYFSEDFETQSDPLGAPDIGVAWRDNGSGDNHELIASPVVGGSNALRLIRDGSSTVNLTGVGNAGALVAGNVVEYVFNINQIAFGSEPTHNLNSPIQNRIGFSNGLSGALLNFGTLDGGNENYYVTDAGSGNVNTGVAIPRNSAAYDAVRFVLTLTEPAAGQLGGTYEVFIDTDDADGIATTSRGVYNLNTVTIPVGESTNPAFTLQRGASTSSTLYDNISINLVPEPGSMALAMVGGVLMIARRRRSA